jgi:hypothetical protein
MGTLKIGTFNCEWMLAFFGAPKDADWLAEPTIPASFPGVSRGGIQLSPIDDVHDLCRRLATSIRAIDADVLFVEEGPPLQGQMDLFISKFLPGEYISHRSNRDNQSIHALVRTSLQATFVPWVPDAPSSAPLWSGIPYYPWGAIAAADRKTHRFARQPLFLRGSLVPGQDLILGGVHTKSKFSQLKTRKQWEDRATKPDPVLDALGSRAKLSAEVARLRDVLTQVISVGPSQASVALLGDFNDGPFHDLMEREFLIHNILDELVGSFLDPNTYFKHAMEPDVLAKAATTRFRDPLENGALVEELIDHILVSPAIWSEIGGYRLQAGSARVEEAAWEAGVVDDPDARRENRPSDHKPVSAVIEWT